MWALNRQLGVCSRCLTSYQSIQDPDQAGVLLTPPPPPLLVTACLALLRQGANAQFDFFFGQGNSVINATNVVRNRRSCTDSNTAVKLVLRTKRAARFPGVNTEQVVELADLTWRGQLFPNTLHLVNYSVEFPRHYNGGYMVVSAGCLCSSSHRVCARLDAAGKSRCWSCF